VKSVFGGVRGLGLGLETKVMVVAMVSVLGQKDLELSRLLHR